MFLAFPLDYQLEEFIKATVAPFGIKLYWHQGLNKSRTLVRCLILAPERVLRSLVISQGTTLGGNGRSWTVPTFILGGILSDEMPGDEDPIPADGNPHPIHGPPLAGNPNNFQGWMHDMAGAGAQVFGDVGISVQQMQDINMDISPLGQNNNLEGDQAVGGDDQMNLDVVENWVPQHPDQPQDTITFNQSGSTANYLRATGPDIHLTVEEILAGIQNGDGSDGSDDSGAVSSARSANVIVPSFILRAYQKLPASSLPLVTLKSPVAEWKEDIQRAILPVQPVMGSILIKLWAFLFGDKNTRLLLLRAMSLLGLFPSLRWFLVGRAPKHLLLTPWFEGVCA